MDLVLEDVYYRAMGLVLELYIFFRVFVLGFLR